MTTASATWWFLSSGAGDCAFNMALDEALLEAMPRLRRPVLRFYSWTRPAASFGYFQRHAEVERLTPLRPLVRRPTGGGIVPHEADWTYSLVFPASHHWYAIAAVESYRRVHQWVKAAFAGLDIQTELAGPAHRLAPGQCFVGYVQFDLLWRGQKIAGAAQRRRRDGLLIQGSVQPPPLPLARTDWERAMLDAARLQQGVGWEAMQLDAPSHERALALASQKYSQPGHTRRH
jgi:lipoyl(octanoyl) transferase